MATNTFERHIRISALEHQRATRFLNRASWAMIAVLGAMAAAMWAAPFARASGHLRLVRMAATIVVLGLLALIALVVMLRRRLAIQIDRVSEHQELLVTQNDRLTSQNEELEEQTAALQEQATELEAHAADLERGVRNLQTSEARQHRLAEELKLLSRRLNEAQHVAHLAYWEIDAGTGDVFWSDEMYRLVGLEPGIQPPPADRFLQALHPEDQPRMREVADRALNELVEFTEQYRLMGPGSSTRTVQAKGRVFVDDHGSRKLVGTVQDITDRLELEARLRQSQKMEAVGQLAGGVAHDFNNLLTVIEGYTGLLALDRSVPDQPRQQIAEIREAARRAASLTRQLLAFSRQQVLQPRVLSVNDAIASTEKMLHRLIGEHIEFHTRLNPDIHYVKADPGQIEQLLLNLVVNARDAMPDGGKITIETANAVLDPTYAQRHPVKTPGPHVMLAVTDTGCGIPPETIDRIFEPFFTTKESGKGTGLGLSTVHGIVEQSGGHVWVYSEVGRGSTFKVYLPACRLDEDVRPASEQAPAPSRGNEAILLVEDDASLRQVAATILTRAGYTVLQAKNGVEALALCEDEGTRLDLLLSDMVMPTMSGRELATRVQALRPAVPTLLMSGYTRDSMVHRSDFSAAAFIEKPFTPEALMLKVRDVLDRRPPAP